MALIENTLFGTINREKQALERIKIHAPIAVELTGKPFYVAYSGGKDGDVIRILCELAGNKYDLVHNHTTVDAPETVYYVRSIPNIKISYPQLTMWDLIVKKGFPPLRMKRYCCDYLKEQGGKDRFIMTGVRWAESSKRKKNRGGLEILSRKKAEKLILNADNGEDRRLFENCIKKGKRILNPIIDWSDKDVWEFLNYYGCKSNPLYEYGHKRIGCIGCPMTGKSRLREFEQYPIYKANYIRTFQRMIDTHDYNKTSNRWKTGEQVFDWWISEKKIPKEVKGQLSLWDEV